MVGNRRYGNMGRYMMCIKTLDLLLPVYALASAVVLSHDSIDPPRD